VPGHFWNFFDALLVLVTGVIVVWILPLIGVQSGGSSLQTLTVLRALRLARLVRVVQKFEAFHEVWLLLRGLMESGRVLFWTVVVIAFITYMFAVFGVVLLGVQIKDEYDDAAATPEGVTSDLEDLVDVTGGVLPLMYTLIQVLTLDSWNSIARPMMKHIGWSWCFFYLYIAIAVIVMMNLVTAVIVENALKNSQKDANALLKEKEKQTRTQLARYQQVFESMDVDGDGELSWPEFESAFEDKELSAELRLLGIEPGNSKDVFNMLDTGDGVLSVQEFFEGLVCMEGAANAKDLLRTNRTVDLIVKLLCQQNQELREDLDELLRVTPGAKVRVRKGSLKSRARRHQASDEIFHTNGTDGTETAESAQSFAILKGRSFHRAEEASLSTVAGKLEQVTALLHESRQEFQESLVACTKSLESCHTRISMLSGDAFGPKPITPKARPVHITLGMEADAPCGPMLAQRSQRPPDFLSDRWCTPKTPRQPSATLAARQPPFVPSEHTSAYQGYDCN
jgi:hypothetical protein